MSSKKIESWKAQNIARRIAAKAFDHLLKPFEEKIQILVKELYDELMQGIDPKWLLTSGYGTSCSSLFIEVDDGRGNEETFTLRDTFSNIEPDEDDERGPFIRPSGFNPRLRITNPVGYQKLMDICKAMKPYKDQQEALIGELSRQMNNKTVTQACKAWPEVASIIREYMGVEDTAPMTVPFEQLLGKFLLALPAPQAQAV